MSYRLFLEEKLLFLLVTQYLFPNLKLFRQNTYLRNKNHTLTCQGGTGCYRYNYQPGS